MMIGLDDARWSHMLDDMDNPYAPDGYVPVFMQYQREEGDFIFAPRVASVRALMPGPDDASIARRIVAALNYCRGLRTEELEGGR